MKFSSRKFGFFKLVAAVVVAVGLIAGDAFSQDLDIFSGRGIGSSLQRELQQANQARPPMPNINNFSRDVTPSSVRNPFSGLFKKPKLPTWDGQTAKPLSEFQIPEAPAKPFANLFPKRNSNKPNFLQKMNLKSKGFLDKTADWAKGKKDEVRESALEPWGKATGTWNDVIRDFKANESKLREQATIPAQPAFRSAEAIGEPKLRF